MPRTINGSTTQWRRLRARILARDNYRCQIQGPHCTTVATCVDHIRGLDCLDPQYLRAACQPCNARYRPPRDPQPVGNTQW